MFSLALLILLCCRQYCFHFTRYWNNFEYADTNELTKYVYYYLRRINICTKNNLAKSGSINFIIDWCHINIINSQYQCKTLLIYCCKMRQPWLALILMLLATEHIYLIFEKAAKHCESIECQWVWVYSNLLFFYYLQHFFY